MKKLSRFKASMPARKFKPLIAALEATTKDAWVYVGGEELVIRALDPSQVSLIVLVLPRTIWTEYEYTEGGAVPFTVNSLHRFVQLSGPSDSILFYFDEENKFHVDISREGEVYAETHFTALSYATEEPPKPPEMKFDAELIVAPSWLARVVRAVKLVDSEITFEAKGEVVRVSGLDYSGDAVALTYRAMGLDAPDVRSVKAESVKAKYKVIYMEDYAKFAAVSESLLMQYSEDFPMRLTWSLVGGGEVLNLLAALLPKDIAEARIEERAAEMQVAAQEKAEAERVAAEQAEKKEKPKKKEKTKKEKPEKKEKSKRGE